MMDARVIVEPSSISPGTGGPATGDIVVALGSEVFPMRGWNDFVVVVLEAWSSALARLLGGVAESQQVHFMEGPYAVEISHLTGGGFRLRAIERPNRERVCIDVQPPGIVLSVLSAAEAVLQACREIGCWSVDADRLAKSAGILRGEAARLTN